MLCEKCRQESRYNGYENYETWSVTLWIGNDEGLCDLFNSVAEENKEQYSEEYALYATASTIKEFFEENMPDLPCGVYFDLLTSALSEVNWVEVARTLGGNE